MDLGDHDAPRVKIRGVHPARWSGAFRLRLDGLAPLELKYEVSGNRLVGSIADNALADGLAQVNPYMPSGFSVNIKGVDFSDIQAELDVAINERISEIGVPVPDNDPVISAALRRAAAQVNEKLQRDVLRVTDYIWHTQEDDRVRPAHQANDGRQFGWDALADGMNPGEDYGCRCVAEPVYVPSDLPEIATCSRLTAEKMKLVFPKASDERLAQIADAVYSVVSKGILDNETQLVQFFGQVAVEMGARGATEEDLKYPVDALLGMNYFKDHPDDARKYGYIREDGKITQEPNYEAIANGKYSGVNGNGDYSSGDGWKYRGRGMMHTTGRANYESLTRDYESIFGERVDFLSNPDLLIQPVFAARSAVVFWIEHGLPAIADSGISATVTDQITRKINKYTDSYSKRSGKVAELAESGAFAGACTFSVTTPSFGDE